MFEYVVRKGGLKESEARWFFQQLIVGVDYLHRMVRHCHHMLRMHTSVASRRVMHACVCRMGQRCQLHQAIRRQLSGCAWALTLWSACRVWLAETSSWRTPCWTAARGRC